VAPEVGWGGGLIFVRGDAVRGLTTAAIVWMSCAVGMACGAGLWLLALTVTVGHFVVVFAFPALALRLPTSPFAPTGLRVVYEDGRGILRDVLAECSRREFRIGGVSTQQLTGAPAVAVMLEVQGRRSVGELAIALDDLDDMLEVTVGDPASD
jgi:putative Mg2+ transporter-C (MgtC) family protein